jgi:hypothetical protein
MNVSPSKRRGQVKSNRDTDQQKEKCKEMQEKGGIGRGNQQLRDFPA